MRNGFRFAFFYLYLCYPHFVMHFANHVGAGFYFILEYNFGHLYQFLTPHFSLTPSSLDRFFYLKCTKMLEKYQKICYNIIDYIRMLQQH